MKVGFYLDTTRKIDEPMPGRLNRSALTGHADTEPGNETKPDAIDRPPAAYDLEVSSIGIASEDPWNDNIGTDVDTSER